METKRTIYKVIHESKRDFQVGDKVEVRTVKGWGCCLREAGYYVFQVGDFYRDQIKVATEFGIRSFAEKDLSLLVPTRVVGLSDWERVEEPSEETVNHGIPQTGLTMVQQERFNDNVARRSVPPPARGCYHCVLCNAPFPWYERPDVWVCTRCRVETMPKKMISSRGAM